MSSCASRSSKSVKSSWSDKSSRYNRKRASVASHTQCVRHIGSSSEAASGNVVDSWILELAFVTEFTVGKEFTVGQEFTVQ